MLYNHNLFSGYISSNRNKLEKILMKVYNMEGSLPWRIYVPTPYSVSEVFASAQLVVPMSLLNF